MPHPKYLRRFLTAQDFNEWRAYAALEPFGSVRDDARAGMLAHLAYNANRGKDAPVLLWHDFFGNIETYEIKQEKERKLRADPVKSSEIAIGVFKAFNARMAKVAEQNKKRGIKPN